MPAIILLLALFLLSCDGRTCDDVVGPGDLGPSVGFDTTYWLSFQYKWRDAKIACYEFEYQRNMGLLAESPVLVQVQHGKVIRAVQDNYEYLPPATSVFPTIDSLYTLIERKRHGYGEERWAVRDLYDQRYGVPLYFEATSLDTSGYPRCYDCSEGFIVTRFTPLCCP